MLLRECCRGWCWWELGWWPPAGVKGGGGEGSAWKLWYAPPAALYRRRLEPLGDMAVS